MAEGGALLRRYVGINLRRGFESLLLRSRGGRARPGQAPVGRECGTLRCPSLGEVAERSNASVSKTVTRR